MRHRIPITRAWVKWRESILVGEEDRASREARDTAPPELRAFMDELVAERERNKLMASRERPARDDS